jgi:hypothetical protein
MALLRITHMPSFRLTVMLAALALLPLILAACGGHGGGY